MPTRVMDAARWLLVSMASTVHCSCEWRHDACLCQCSACALPVQHMCVHVTAAHVCAAAPAVACMPVCRFAAAAMNTTTCVVSSPTHSHNNNDSRSRSVVTDSPRPMCACGIAPKVFRGNAAAASVDRGSCLIPCSTQAHLLMDKYDVRHVMDATSMRRLSQSSTAPQRESRRPCVPKPMPCWMSAPDSPPRLAQLRDSDNTGESNTDNVS